MRSRSRRLSAVTAAVLALVLLAAACGSDDDTSTDEGSGNTSAPNATEQVEGETDGYEALSGEINGSGASFPDVFYQEAITAFADVAPDLTVTYNAIGSGSGKEEFGQNLNDFAGSDSLVGDDDGPEPGSYIYIPTTAASVTAAYNLPGVDGLQLTADALAQIFQREITVWNDPAIAEVNPDLELPDTEIIVARRADGSGTTANFTAYLEDAAPDVWTLGSDDTVEWPADTQAGPQNTGVAQIVTDSEGAIGYVDLGDATALGLQMAAIENAEGNFVEPSVEATTAALDGAELADDLTYSPLNGPGEDAYPITAPTYILVRTTYDDQETADNVIGFVSWLITEGGDYAPDAGFAPVPERFQEAGLEALEQVTVG